MYPCLLSVFCEWRTEGDRFEAVRILRVSTGVRGTRSYNNPLRDYIFFTASLQENYGNFTLQNVYRISKKGNKHIYRLLKYTVKRSWIFLPARKPFFMFLLATLRVDATFCSLSRELKETISQLH